MNRRSSLASCLFVTILFFSVVNLCVAEKFERQSGWSALGGGLSGGDLGTVNSEDELLDGSVLSLVVSPDGTLYVSGDFTKAGDVRAHSIAKWDGSSWSALGNGIDLPAEALAVANDGSLFAVGLFAELEGQIIPGKIRQSTVARWDGSKWLSLGKSPLGFVRAMLVDKEGSLYIAGAGDYGRPSLLKLVGNRWFSVDSSAISASPGHSSWFAALGMDTSGILYAGGTFATVGTVSANGIALLNHSKWGPLASGIAGDGFVNALSVAKDGALYAGGWFKAAGGVRARSIAKWDGKNWSSLGAGINGSVNAIAVGLDGSVFAAGNMQGSIFRFVGNKWVTLDAGVDDDVNALAVGPDGSVYVGGLFRKAGKLRVNFVAKWSRWK